MLNNDFYEVDINGRIATILIKNNVFKLLTAQDESGLLFDTLSAFSSDKQIKALLFLNRPGCLGDKVYENFINKIVSPESNNEENLVPKLADRNKRFREINILNRFVDYIANYNKLCFCVLSGDIVTPFIGLALSTDIRYATPEMNFSLAHNKYGLHPSGGLPFFLVQQLGYSRAIELMLSENISATEALELGLIKKTVPSENFLETVISDIEKITKHRSYTLRKTKMLSAYTRNSLSDYFTYESSLLNLI